MTMKESQIEEAEEVYQEGKEQVEEEKISEQRSKPSFPEWSSRFTLKTTSVREITLDFSLLPTELKKGLNVAVAL